MTEYNVYVLDSEANQHYLFTTLADSYADVMKELEKDREFLTEAIGQNRGRFRVVTTELDDRSRDELIFDYIIEADDSTSTARSE